MESKISFYMLKLGVVSREMVLMPFNYKEGRLNFNNVKLWADRNQYLTANIR